MFPAAFGYVRTTSMRELFNALAKHGADVGVRKD